MSQILDIVGKLLFLVWFLWITFTVADLSGKVKRLREQDTRSPTLRAAVLPDALEPLFINQWFCAECGEWHPEDVFHCPNSAHSQPSGGG